MSTNRVKRDSGWVHPAKLPKGPNGRNLCRQCSREVSGRRRTFCSDACVDAWKIRTDPGHARALVFQRDRGVCAGCGLDTQALERRAPTGWRRWHRSTDAMTPAEWRDELKRLGYPVNWSRSLWDADHIVPVVEGGGECDLDNYRTLCVPCHRKVTAELRARLARRRREGRAG